MIQTTQHRQLQPEDRMTMASMKQQAVLAFKIGGDDQHLRVQESLTRGCRHSLRLRAEVESESLAFSRQTWPPRSAAATRVSGCCWSAAQIVASLIFF